MARPEKQRPDSLSEEALDGLFRAEHRPTHEQIWGELEAAHAPLAREALVRAQIIREGGQDPGDAYLRGVAEANAWRDRQDLIKAARATIETLPEKTDSEQ
jgi:hypothetical protein